MSQTNSNNPKIALAHDFLLYQGGAERVLKEISSLFPKAPIFTLLHDEKEIVKILGAKRKIIASFLNKSPSFLPYHWLLPFYPIAAESINLREYDAVISSTSSFMKGVVVKPRTVHICYCHTPTRYLWDWSEEYLEEIFGKRRFLSPKNFVIRSVLNYLRIWDQSSAKRVDKFIANSNFTARRIKKYYKRKAKVIYPPVDTEKFLGKDGTKGRYYLVVSRLSAYKKIHLVVEAFNRLKWPLYIAGTGRERKNLEKIAGPNIRFLGFVKEEKLPKLYAGCKALIFPGEDDFGITIVEALASGKPVLALRAGGALEILEEGKTGEFFGSPEPEILVDGLRRLKENFRNYSSDYMRQSAKRFSKERFKGEFTTFVGEALDARK